jgi:hypothetical protein
MPVLGKWNGPQTSGVVFSDKKWLLSEVGKVAKGNKLSIFIAAEG